MATVYKRGDVYYAKFLNEHGRRTSRNTGVSLKREALKVAARYEAEALELRRQAKDKPRELAKVLETAAGVRPSEDTRFDSEKGDQAAKTVGA